MKIVLDIAFFFHHHLFDLKDNGNDKKQEMICSSNCAQSMLFDCVCCQLVSFKVIIILILVRVSLPMSPIVDFASTLMLINVA